MQGRHGYRLFALLLLLAIGAQRVVTLHRPREVTAYHQRIREAFDTAPRQIGGWVSDDIHVPRQAMSLLTPNAIVSRRYTNIETGVTAGVMVVHCSDAHDMAGHFPLRCFPADGWIHRSSTPRDWRIGDLVVTGAEYEFVKTENLGATASEHTIVVANCLFRSDGRILRDMDAMTASIIGAGGQASGAGQIQISFNSTVSQAQRDQAVATLIGGFRPALDAILAPANR